MTRNVTHRVLTVLLSMLVGGGAVAASKEQNMLAHTDSAAVPAAAQPVADPHAPDSAARQAMIKTFWDTSEALTPRFEVRTHTRGELAMPYRLFVPAIDPNKAPDQRYPLVIFLHGAGGRGNDNETQYTAGNRFGTHIWAMPENQKEHPCFILAPQTEQAWYAHDGHGGRMAPNPEEPDTGLTPAAASVLEIIEQLIEQYPIDRNRLILTGQSMGGGGTWYLLTKRPHMFAAAMPICGVWAEPEIAPAIAHVPLWIFHGEQDRAVPVDVSRAMVEALKAADGSPAYTEYAGVGHNSWNWAYTEPALVPWAMAQRRSPR